MSESIHGHEVLNMLLAQPQGVTKAELKVQMAAQFGAEARFHTCSASDMNSDELIAFLEQKGKFVPAETGISTRADKICQH